MYISRINRNGKSIAPQIYRAVDAGLIPIIKIMDINKSTRLDQYAAEYWGPENSKNWWIIAAASGIGWMFDNTIEENGIEEAITIFIPDFKATKDYINTII